MSTLGPALVLYLLLVGVLALATSFGAPLATATATGAVVAELLLLVNAGADLARLAGGRSAAEPAVHLGYVLVSVLLLPLLLAQRLTRRSRAAVLSLACLAAVVVVVRQAATS